MEARRVANSHHFDVEQDPDPHSNGASDPDPQRNEEMNPEVKQIRDPGYTHVLYPDTIGSLYCLVVKDKSYGTSAGAESKTRSDHFFALEKFRKIF
jgi:hypothetical protein